MIVSEMSMRVPAAGDAMGETVSVSTSTAAMTNGMKETSAVVYSTVECFAVFGDSPTATAAAGIPIPANSPMRLHGWAKGQKLAFITSTGTGNVYVRPGA